jgi:hypothetical protein
MNIIVFERAGAVLAGKHETATVSRTEGVSVERPMVVDGNEGGRMGRQRRLPPGVSNPIDIHIGNRLWFHRTSLGYSQ